MSWRDQWPGLPREPETEPTEKTTAEFRVALKSSACKISAEIAALREDAGEIVTFESRTEAVAELLEGSDRDDLRFQRPAPNDPGAADVYLVAVLDSEPEPAERGPPEDGWTFDMRAQQVGALSESLLSAYSWDPPPIVSYVAADLGLEPDAVRIEVDQSPGSVGRSERDGGDGRWLPDVEFIVRRRNGSHPDGYDGPVIKRYLAEVKHGSTSFERHQRTRMTRLAAETGANLEVLVIRVDLEGTPQTYDLTIRTVSADE
ncbi:hypothetical protein [Natrinema gelatinilyticum]|uniref:hypothetical protein n=1 Tax=Natrinema gelatinilyticum TaxID=2961571 RepID=UPI0020C4A351|nr:hypothetical protein [Natrinema gelatinilyticum]